MTRLMRASEIAQRPVVTMAGEDVAQVKDIVYTAAGGTVSGFTLAGRGVFAGPLDRGLPWASVASLGSHAVMIADESVLGPLTAEAAGESVPSRGDVLGAQVLTQTGTDLGTVVDVIVEVGAAGTGTCDVVGYEIEASEALDAQGTRMLIPLPDTMTASGEHLMVPPSAKNFVRRDLAGFGAAVEEFRTQLRQEHE